MNRIIHILLADDYPIVREGLKAILEAEPDIEVVAVTENGRETLAQIGRLIPDVAILPCELPDMSGPEVTIQLQQQDLPTQVLALCTEADDRTVWDMLEAGAAGFLSKREAPEIIVQAVRATARGEGWFSPEVAARIATWMRGEPEPRADELTEREWEVLQYIVKGWTNKQIAQELGVSRRTVGFHVRNLLGKLEAENRTQAAIEAIRRGWIEV